MVVAIDFAAETITMGSTQGTTDVLGRQSLQMMEGTDSVGQPDLKLTETKG